jgi:sporulation protein YlmC with PRC-barrel domain
MSTTDLVRLADTDLVLATPADDVRGKPVLDLDGADVGEVDDLVVDEDERRVRLLQVGSGGFLGIGKRKVLIPVDAVTAVDHAVHIDTDRGHVANGPVYDPDLVLGKNIVTELYDHYGMLPYWNRR